MNWHQAVGTLVLGIMLGTRAEARDLLCADALFGLERHMSVEQSELNADVTYSLLPDPEVSFYYLSADSKHEKMEVARITHANDSVLQGLLDEVHELGGEVRLLRGRVSDSEGQFLRWANESPYFWVNLQPKMPSYLKRIVAFDPTQPRALASLAHEIQHLRVWTKAFHEALASGLDQVAASSRAWDQTNTLESILEGERLAVEAEIAMELAHPHHRFNRPYAKPNAVNFWEPGYVARLTYPEYQVVRQAMLHHKDLVDHYLEPWVDKAERLRARALAYLPEGDPRRTYWEETPLLKLMLGDWGHVRLESENTMKVLETAVGRLRP